jgi:proteic killer suppression protein
MIVSFGDKATGHIWAGNAINSLSAELQVTARRKLRMLNSSLDIRDLMIPPSNRLEKLKGKWKEFYSIRLNNRWRIIFKWTNGNAYEVQIIDYH